MRSIALVSMAFVNGAIAVVTYTPAVETYGPLALLWLAMLCANSFLAGVGLFVVVEHYGWR